MNLVPFVLHVLFVTIVHCAPRCEPADQALGKQEKRLYIYMSDIAPHSGSKKLAIKRATMRLDTTVIMPNVCVFLNRKYSRRIYITLVHVLIV